MTIVAQKGRWKRHWWREKNPASWLSKPTSWSSNLTTSALLTGFQRKSNAAIGLGYWRKWRGQNHIAEYVAGNLTPDAGNVRLGKNLSVLELDQARSGIKKDWTIKDALTDGAGDLVSIGEETMHVIGYMKLLFHPAQMRTPANVLSGGELARLLLARGASTVQCTGDG